MIRFKKDDGSNYPEWQDKKMKDVITLLRGSSPRPIVNYVTSDGSGVNWIKIGDMPKTGSLVTSVSEKITEEGAKKSRKVNIGDLILSNSMSFGKPYILGIEGYIHDGWFVIRDYEENFNRDYLCQLLASETVQHQYNSLSAGGVVQNISSDIVNSVKIKLPCLEEQQKIADFLSSVDDVITASEQEVTALEEQKKGVMQKIFSQEVRFKADDGSDYPEWEEKRIEDIFRITRGYVLSKDNLIEKADDKILYPVYSSQTLNDGLMGYYDEFLYENAITWTTDGANAGTVKYREGKFYCTNVCGVLISDKYANKCIANILGMESYKHVSQKGANPKLMNNVMGKIKITIPVSIEEQTKISDFLSDIDTAIDLAKQELKQWKELKKGLLQQLFE